MAIEQSELALTQEQAIERCRQDVIDGRDLALAAAFYARRIAADDVIALAIRGLTELTRERIAGL